MVRIELRLSVPDPEDVTPTKKRTYSGRVIHRGPKLKLEETFDEASPTREKAFAQDNDESVMVTAIDFGMTGSAISYAAYDCDVRDVGAETVWPGSRERRTKVPSMIAYAHENPGHSDFRNSDSVFGFKVKPSMTRHDLCKKWLDEPAQRSQYDDKILDSEAAALLLGPGNSDTTRNAVVDQIRWLNGINNQRMTKECTRSQSHAMKQTFVLSHPAACSAEGIKRLRDVAIDAGILSQEGDKLNFISEAVAAAVGTLIQSRRKLGNKVFKKGDLITVVDIGGLTVDSATHAITQTDPLQLDEKAVANGGKCGTISIYGRVYELLINLFGENFTKLPKASLQHGSRLIQDLENELRTFEGDDLDEEIRLRQRLDNGQYPGRYDDGYGEIILTGHDLVKILDITVKNITDIITEQVNNAFSDKQKRVSVVVLCGGGSLFPYIFNSVKQFCLNLKPDSIDMIRPDDPQAVVACGAAMAFLQKKIIHTRISRFCVGVKVDQKFRPGNWKKEDLYNCPRRGQRIDGFASWHLHAGEKIDMRGKKSNRLRHIDRILTLSLADLDDPTRELVIPIYICSGEAPFPDRIDDPRVRRLGVCQVKPQEMAADKKKALRKQIKESSSGKGCVKIQIDQDVGTDAGVLNFLFKVGKKVIGTYELDYDALQHA